MGLNQCRKVFHLLPTPLGRLRCDMNESLLGSRGSGVFPKPKNKKSESEKRENFEPFT